MLESMVSLLRCPVTQSSLTLKIIDKGKKELNGEETEIITNAILFSATDWIYPVVNGIPRLLVESFLEYADFLRRHISDYDQRKANLQQKHAALLDIAERKSRKTKRSFELEWQIYNYEEDKTWGADRAAMLLRFFEETGETQRSIKNKLIFDAGCGNGLLNQLVAAQGALILGMDFSHSIEKAFEKNKERNALFIQGDVQHPPVPLHSFDIVHCSGVLIHTDNTEQSFHCIEPCVRQQGKLSVWLYHPQKDAVHNLLLQLRKITTRLPIRLQYFFYQSTLFPVTYIIKRLKGNKQSKREMMMELIDQFSPEYRWEHEHAEVIEWYEKSGYAPVRITTENKFGFNITGIKSRI